MTRPVPKIEIGGREYSRFIQWPSEVRDGTVRCFQCGQMDEPEYHLDEYCTRDGKQRYARDRRDGTKEN